MAYALSLFLWSSTPDRIRYQQLDGFPDFDQQRAYRKINSAKYTRKRFERLKEEMEGISKEQQSIKLGQSQVRAKFNAIEEECEQLRNETNQIIRQSANAQIRLGLMFSILKAREQGDVGKAAQLTRLLREIVG